ncbi:MAG: hypothetical protein ACRDTD_14535, partial [Pseudonocardiaceae bacterium]
VRTESTGDFYTLHHTMIHSVTTQPYTTSLIVRGPEVKDRSWSPTASPDKRGGSTARPPNRPTKLPASG